MRCKRTWVFLLVFLLSLNSSIPVSAQDTTFSSPSSKTLRQELPQKIQANRENLQGRIQELRDELKQKRKEAQELFKEKREEFKTRLQKIKDVRKKTLVEQIDEKISTINKNRADHFLQVLERLEVILDRIRDKAETAQTNGKDTSNLSSAIAAAQDAISTAKSAIITQAGKDYVIDASDEAMLKNAVGKTTSQFRKDLRDTHKAVVDAKQAVRKAASERANLASAKGINNPVGATRSGGTE